MMEMVIVLALGALGGGCSGGSCAATHALAPAKAKVEKIRSKSREILHNRAHRRARCK